MVTPPHRQVQHLTDDDLLDLGHGLLATERRESAVAHLKDCASCESVFREREAERARVLARPLPASHGSERGPIGMEGFGNNRPRSRRRLLWGVLAAAAVLVVLVPMVRGPGPGPDPWLPAGALIEQLDGELVMRSGDPDVADVQQLREALRLYTDGDAKGAHALLEGMGPLANRSRDDERLAMLASCKQILGDPEGALKVLEGRTLLFIALPDTRTRITWVRYLALVDLGRDEEATEILKELLAYGLGLTPRILEEAKARGISPEGR